MKIFCEILSKQPSFTAGKGIKVEDIRKAEKELDLRFAVEYFDYLLCFGIASCYGYEFTGICESKRLNVVDVTLEEKEYNKNVPDDFYVIEQVHIDGIVIWQSKKGEIFQTFPNCKPVKIFDSLADYITQM